MYAVNLSALREENPEGTPLKACGPYNAVNATSTTSILAFAVFTTEFTSVSVPKASCCCSFNFQYNSPSSLINTAFPVSRSLTSTSMPNITGFKAAAPWLSSASATIVLANLSVSNPVILAILVISLFAYARYAANCSGLSDSRVIPFEDKALCTVASLTASKVVFISGPLAGPFCP